MTREQIREAIIEMDCLNEMKADALATMIFRAAETGKEEDRLKVTAIIDWLYATDSITLRNGLELKDLWNHKTIESWRRCKGWQTWNI